MTLKRLISNFGISGANPLAGYTWHHVDDFNSVDKTCTMQLVKKDAHRATYPHKGTCGQFDDYFEKNIYNKSKRRK